MWVRNIWKELAAWCSKDNTFILNFPSRNNSHKFEKREKKENAFLYVQKSFVNLTRFFAACSKC